MVLGRKDSGSLVARMHECTNHGGGKKMKEEEEE